MKRGVIVLVAAVLALGVGGPAVRAGDSGRTLLAGFGIKVVGTGVDVSYDSPSAPVPLSPSPTAELAFGYSLATLDAGPIGHALASVLWPGAFIANIPPLVSPQLPIYPVRAEAFSPQGPATSKNSPLPASDMQANASGLLSEASSHAANAGSEAVVSAASAFSTSRTAIENDKAIGRGSATVSGVKIGGGAIAIDGVVTNARITTAGGKPKIEGKTVVAGLTIGGSTATIDDNGVHGAASALEALDASGVSLRLASPADVVKGTAGSRIAAGLLVTLTPAALRTAIASLPPDVAAQVGSTVVLDQTVTVALGSVSVAAAASSALSALTLSAGGGSALAGAPESSSGGLRPIAGEVSRPEAGSLRRSGPPLTPASGLSGAPAFGRSAVVLATRSTGGTRLHGGYGGNAPVWILVALLGALFLGLRIRSVVDTLLFGAEEEE